MTNKIIIVRSERKVVGVCKAKHFRSQIDALKQIARREQNEVENY